MKSVTYLKMLFALLVVFAPTLAHAQIDPGGSPDAPIDGGLSLLLAAGVGYVAKKGYDKRKKQSAETRTSDQ